ncbi:MAG: hypothetical protein MI702_12905, partial [Chlorobiales bacterium]|nr:hypothetical protein [Chlorobiales bacterium]
HPLPSRDCKIWESSSIPLGSSEKKGFDRMGNSKINIKKFHFYFLNKPPQRAGIVHARACL